jgi:hypothetical protein
MVSVLQKNAVSDAVQAEFCLTAFLGAGVHRVNGPPSRKADPLVHPQPEAEEQTVETVYLNVHRNEPSSPASDLDEYVAFRDAPQAFANPAVTIRRKDQTNENSVQDTP